MTLYEDVKNTFGRESFHQNIHNKNIGNKDPQLIEYYGFNYIFMIIKSVYSQEVYTKIQDSNNKNMILSKLNEIINEYNTFYLGTNNNLGKWVNDDLKDVCDPTNSDYPCNPKTLLNLKDLEPLKGNLRVKNKNKEKCYRKCGPDCSDGCFFTPSIPDISIQNTKYFSNVFEQCACIPCFEYINEDGDVKCFQSDIIPNYLESLLNNFKNIYAATKDNNPRTAYYIFSDDFDNEYDVKEDIRLVVKIIEEFINNCRNPLSSKVLDECQKNKKTRDAANPDCKNSEKIFCKNIDMDIPQANKDNCINDSYTFYDIIKDNINGILKPTEMNYCYCQEINPITGDIVDTDENTWTSRKTCKDLNEGGENFHICSDDSYSNELIRELKILRNKFKDTCPSDFNIPGFCGDQLQRDSDNYESYLFNFEYNSTISNDICNHEDINCLTYSGNQKSESPTGGSGSDDQNTEEAITSFVSERENIKDRSVFRYAAQKNYCYCVQKGEKCYKWDTCYGDLNPEDDDDQTAECKTVHDSIFGDSRTIDPQKFGEYITMSSDDIKLAQHHIIDRGICEGNLKCLGYVCENGGADNSNGSSVPHNSNMSYVRDFLYPIIPSYTGKSLKHSLYDTITIPFNSNNQTANINTAGGMKFLGLGDDTLTTTIKKTICNYGDEINQYASIDARAAQVDQREMDNVSRSIWQALNPLSYAGCLGEEIKTIISAIPGIDKPRSTYCRDIGNADRGFFGNITTYVTDYFDQTEDNIIASGLSGIGNTLKDASCDISESNKPINVDYGYIRNNFIYFAAILALMIAIPTIGPIAILIALIITISWNVYKQIRIREKNLEVLSESKDVALNTFWLLLLIIIVLSVIYLIKNKKVRSNIMEKNSNFLKQIKDDVSGFDIFD